MADPLPDWVPLNWLLISNPNNWLMVFLMVLLGTIVFCMISGAVGIANTSGE